MSESSLSITRLGLETEVAARMGLANTASIVDDAVDRGVRRFYFSAYWVDQQGQRQPHEWSFLTVDDTIGVWDDVAGVNAAGLTEDPTLTATAAVFTTGSSMVDKTVTFTTSGNTYTIASVTSTVEVELTTSLAAADITAALAFTMTADGTYSLPDDFGGVNGDMTFATRTFYPPIRQTTVNMVERAWQNSAIVEDFRPSIFAIRPRTSAGTTSVSTRYELMLAQKPDTAYTLIYNKQILVGKATEGSGIYPLGNASTMEALLLSCLAAAEEMTQEAVGTYRNSYDQQIQLAVRSDMKRMRSPNLGYNSDNSDMRERGRRWRGRWPDGNTLYNNTLYQG